MGNVSVLCLGCGRNCEWTSRANERALINHSVGFYDGKQFARAITGRNVVLVDALIAASGPSLLFPPCKCRLSLENLEGKQVFVTGCEGYIIARELWIHFELKISNDEYLSIYSFERINSKFLRKNTTIDIVTPVMQFKERNVWLLWKERRTKSK